ncbi:MAG: RNA polymerase-binding protein DksA, partial [Rhodospirillaceae bacterium]|nr:RNA polymerase-binding protein DksA [Rhodospirillaceae bacterium]
MSSNMLSPDYTPTDKEAFMKPMMEEFFRQRLTA